MFNTDPIPHLLDRVRAGDQHAAAEVHRRYAPRLTALARARLDPRLNRRVDPEDVVQSAFGSFFRCHAADRFEVRDGEGLWRLLALFVLRQCNQEADRVFAACRDSRREELMLSFDEDEGSGSWQAPSAELSPAQIAVLNDTVDALRRDMTDRDSIIFSLALDGWITSEIAEVLQCSERTARRVLADVRSRLERLRSEPH